MQHEIQIRDWKPETRNTLRGFFSAVLPSGLIINRLTLQESHGKRWVGLPSREYLINGETKHAKLLEFVTPAIADKFRDQCLEALDKHRAMPRKPAAQQPLIEDRDWHAL